jgi:outer membrane protein, multidrug efflux system
MRNVKTFILMPFLLAGCTVGPDYAGPPPLGHSAPPPSFVRQPGSVASAAPALADWWTAFNDPVLNDLEKRALAANPSIEAAQARISQARASVRQERANLFPTAGAQATAIFADLPGLDLQSNQGNQSAPTDSASAGNQDNSLSFFNLGLNANWEIDLAGGQRRKIEAANARAAAAVFHAADAQVQLTAEVAQSYINLRERQQRADELRRSREIQQQLLDLTGQRFRQGTVPAFAVGQANRALQSTITELAAAEAETEIYLNAIASLAGEVPGSLDTVLSPGGDVPLPPSQVAVGDPASLIRRRPDIRAAERNIAAATARIGVAEAARFPKISFMGILGVGGTSLGDLADLDNISKIAIPQLQWGLLDFGRTSAAIDQARAGRGEAEATYRQVVLGALQDAESSLSRFAQHRRTVAALAEIKQSADQAAVLMQQRYERGTISRADQLEAERQKILASINLRTALAALTGSYIAIQKSLGMGWASDEKLGEN